MPSCRSSGVLTASGLVYSGKCKLISIHACEVGGSAASIKVYDNTSAAGKEIARIVLTANQTLEFDMHGVICSNGLFFEEASGSVAVSIEFA
jgi:hypothetical protein|tara:strand:- start:1038 stop:1313 length:276 start_codon:yes stop_codon:yes gene_type:complete